MAMTTKMKNWIPLQLHRQLIRGLLLGHNYQRATKMHSSKAPTKKRRLPTVLQEDSPWGFPSRARLKHSPSSPLFSSTLHCIFKHKMLHRPDLIELRSESPRYLSEIQHTRSYFTCHFSLRRKQTSCSVPIAEERQPLAQKLALLSSTIPLALDCSWK